MDCDLSSADLRRRARRSNGWSRWLGAALLSSLCAAEHARAQVGSSGEPAAGWWSHMKFLASDALEGRLTGEPGHRKAAEYAAAQFKKAGLKPAGTRGYFQPIEFVSRQIDESKSRLELVRGGQSQLLDFAQDA